MELHELRARWQQALPPPEPPENLNETALRQLLTRNPGSPVARLERNMRLEFTFAGLAAALSIVGLLLAPAGQLRASLSLLLVVSLLMVPYYLRKTQLIRRLRTVGGSVREHTGQQLRGLRALLRLNYWATLSTLPFSLGLSLFFTGRQLMRELPPGKVTAGLIILGVCYLLLGALFYFGARRWARWWLQKLYGQHLDRLERNLAELDEPAPDVSR